MTHRNNSSVSQLVRLFRSTLSELGHEAAASSIESMSFLVYQAMTGSAREYHAVEHVFSVAAGLPALGRLATIYHDTVYWQVDRGFLPAVWDKIGDTGLMRQDQKGDKFELTSCLDARASDVAAIFGFAPGDAIGTRDGLNEFLSAMLAVRELSPFVSRLEAWTIAACIEATIPFRGKDTQGRLPTEILAERIEKLSKKSGVTLSEAELTQIIQLAVAVANSDVQSFAQVKADEFLADTWKLLPETNPEFHNAGVYSVRSYLEAIAKTENFLSGLNPSHIFQQYKGAPGLKAYAALENRARSNLQAGCEYLRAKIVTMSVLEALASLTGGDAPVAYFIGSNDSGDLMAHSALSNAEKKLHKLLGERDIDQHARRSQLARSGEKNWQWFVDGFPQKAISDFARAVADLAVERREALLQLAKRAGGSQKTSRKRA